MLSMLYVNDISIKLEKNENFTYTLEPSNSLYIYLREMHTDVPRITYQRMFIAALLIIAKS